MPAKLTVMTAEPSPTAIIFPSSTFTTDALLEVKVRLPAPAGVNVAPVPTESRTINSRVAFSTVISV